MNIGGIEIGSGQPCRFVAEISCNHGGSQRRAHDLIIAAKEAGADFVKFQAYTPDELVALRGDGPAPEPWGGQGWTMRALYEKAQTPLTWLPELFQHARDIGLVPFSSVFGPESLAALEAIGCEAYKISHFEAEIPEWICKVRDCGRPLIISARDPFYIAGVSPEVDPVTGLILNPFSLPDDVIALFCTPGYPTLAADVHLPTFAGRHRLNGFTGLSSHCLDPLLPVAAVARGCKLIEIHMMLAAEPSELESNVSLTEYQFKGMVEAVRHVEEMLA